MMTDNQKWHQVFKLRSDQTIGQLFELIPIIARNTENHLNWLGPGYYFWKEEDQALDWGKRYHSCKATDLVIASVLIAIAGERIFDPQEIDDHKLILDQIRTMILNDANRRGLSPHLRKNHFSECLKKLVSSKDFYVFGFQATKYRDPIEPKKGQVQLVMAAHTPNAIYLQYRIMLCVYEPFKNTIKRQETVYPKEKP